jgi:hypothetical protein
MKDGENERRREWKTERMKDKENERNIMKYRENEKQSEWKTDRMNPEAQWKTDWKKEKERKNYKVELFLVGPYFCNSYQVYRCYEP